MWKILSGSASASVWENTRAREFYTFPIAILSGTIGGTSRATFEIPAR